MAVQSYHACARGAQVGAYEPWRRLGGRLYVRSPRAAGRAGVPPGHKKRAAHAALENHGWNIRRHSGVCRCQCSIRRSRSLSEIIGTGVNVKPSGVR